MNVSQFKKPFDVVPAKGGEEISGGPEKGTFGNSGRLVEGETNVGSRPVKDKVPVLLFEPIVGGVGDSRKPEVTELSGE